MREYSLRFREGSTENPKTITFQSEDAHEAFSILEQEKPSGPAELHDGDRSLGTITQSSSGGWILDGSENSDKSRS